MGIFTTFSRRSKEHYLALDIGTEVVKALVFYIDKDDGAGVIVGAAREAQARGNMQSGAISDISGVIATCRRAIDNAARAAHVKDVSKTVMGVAGELVKGTTTTVHYERAHPQMRLEVQELREIIQRVQWKTFERIKEQVEWDTGRATDIRLINAAIVDVRIDGYRVANPLNFQGKSLSVSVFNAYAPLMHIGAIDSIADALHLDLINIAAEPYAVSASVGYEDILDFSGIFIDIGGGTTDIAVVRNGGLEGTKMFALGGRAFSKRLGQALRVSVDEAEALKIKYGQGLLPRNVAEQFTRILMQDSRVWLGGVELSLMEFAEKDMLPANIYLCGGGSALPEVGYALSSEGWTKKLPFTKKPTISFLQPKDVVNVIDRTGTMNNPQDITPMALANLVVGMTAEERSITQILVKAMRDVQR